MPWIIPPSIWVLALCGTGILLFGKYTHNQKEQMVGIVGQEAERFKIQRRNFWYSKHYNCFVENVDVRTINVCTLFVETITRGKSTKEKNYFWAHQRQGPWSNSIYFQQHLLQRNAIRQWPWTVLFVCTCGPKIFNITEGEIGAWE